jgi:heat-inducible transcriptional repressor
VGTELGQADTESDAGLGAAVQSVLDETASALSRASRQSAEIYVGGTRQMATVWNNLSTVHRVLEVLEREAKLLEMLAHGSGTTIQLAEELGVPADMDLAVVSSSIDGGPAAEGRVGVIGPMRIDYRRVISAVETVSRELGDRAAQ